MSNESPKNPFSQAIEATQQTIQNRTRHYRNLVIMTTIIILLSLILAIIQFAWQPMLGCLSLIPANGLFIYLDNRQVNHWQQQLLDFWNQQQLDLEHFATTIAGFRHLPSHTLQGMLNTLPPKSVRTANNLPPTTHEALTLTLQTINRYQNQQILFATLMITTSVVAFALSLLLWSWLPLLSLLLIPIFKGINYSFGNALIFRLWKKRLLKLPKLDRQQFIQLANQLNWQAIAAERKLAWLESINLQKLNNHQQSR
jgi:hypothetical protein